MGDRGRRRARERELAELEELERARARRRERWRAPFRALRRRLKVWPLPPRSLGTLTNDDTDRMEG